MDATDEIRAIRQTMTTPEDDVKPKGTWLDKYVTKKPTRAARPELKVVTTTAPVDDPRARRYAEKALDQACQNIAAAPEGTRNHTLNSESFSIGGLVKAGYLDAEVAVLDLTDAGLHSGLDQREVDNTVTRAINDADPRPVELEDTPINDDSKLGFTPTTPGGESKRSIRLVKASQVRTERLDWLIDSWVPRRSLTLLAGREGLGKSTIACGIAAQATRGELDGRPMNVAYLNTEDSRSITVKPRLQAAGADLDRVFFIDVNTETGGNGALTLPGDTGLLADALAEANVGLVILDAAKSAMHSSLDGYRDDDVRQFLEPLAAMCDEHDMAVIGLVHFGKRESTDPGKLILGSVAWSQIARSVLSVAVDDEGTLVVTNTKGNLAPAQISREARLESVTIPTDDGKTTDVGRVVWGDNTNVSAAELLASRDDQDDDRTDCEIWLGDYLAQHGPTRRKKVLDDARKAGFTVAKTVQRAFKKIGGVSGYTATVPREAEWSVPDLSFEDTRDTGDTPVVAHVPTVPTVPTGVDQRKQNVPTGGESQQGHKGHVQGTPVPPVPTAIDPVARAAVLEGLSDHPQTIEQIRKQVTRSYRDQVPTIVPTLVADGAAEDHGNGTYSLA